VRLGVIGPLQAQGLQLRMSAPAAVLAARCGQIPLQETTQTAPVADLLQGAQDRLYSRLFIS
jgi:urease accessory protein